MKKTLQTSTPLNDIIVGDVGSGKTIVAILLLLNYIHGFEEENCTALLLAPTEVLAKQHYLGILSLTTKLPKEIDIYFISGKEASKNGEKLSKKLCLLELESDSKRLIVGTHALLHLPNIQPSFVVVDEQQRLGVKQRQKLTDTKHEKLSAHYLSLSATPIPRTLALTVFKNLSLHNLERLSGRSEILTKLVTFEQDNLLLETMKERIALGQKTYIVCPKIEEGEDEEWSVKKTTKYFEQHFPGVVLSLTGKDKQKQDILTQFKTDDSKKILIATTVIEVGVDVSSATLMIVMHAEKFGLSALHQIRGRIGRNSFENNTCLLVTIPQFLRNPRLQTLLVMNNGFEIAQRDLELRGSGDVSGVVQSGFDGDLTALMSLDPETYERLSSYVDTINFEKPELVRLKNYVVKKTQDIWGE
jgi:ATP-dependent DNA helicase RecG